MMSAISTAALFGSLRSNMDTTQTQIAQDAAEVASQKISTDLSGYGTTAGSLTTLNSLSSRTDSYLAGAQALTGKLNVQDQALTAVSTAAQSARSAVAEALANGSGSAMMDTLQAQLTAAAGALNTSYDGQYLFSGGQASTQPVAATSMSDLAAASPLSSIFRNGTLKGSSRLDDATVVQTGVLASDAGTPLMGALQAVATYDAGPDGPFGSPLTSAQTTFLNGVLGQFDTAVSATTATTAANGVVSQQVATATTALTDRQTALKGVVANLTTPDEAQVASQLSLAQTTLQASAQIFASLQDDSLLKVLGS